MCDYFYDITDRSDCDCSLFGIIPLPNQWMSRLMHHEFVVWLNAYMLALIGEIIKVKAAELFDDAQLNTHEHRHFATYNSYGIRTPYLLVDQHVGVPAFAVIAYDPQTLTINVTIRSCDANEGDQTVMSFSVPIRDVNSSVMAFAQWQQQMIKAFLEDAEFEQNVMRDMWGK